MNQPNVPSDNEIADEGSILFAGNNGATPLLVWTDKTLKNLKIHAIGTKQVTTVAIKSNKDEQVDKVTAHVPTSASVAPHFLVHYQTSNSNWAEVYHIDSKSQKAKKAFDLPVVAGRGAISISFQGSESYFVRHSASSISIIGSASANVFAEWNLSTHQGRSPVGIQEPQSVTSEVLHRGGSKYSLRSAAVRPSGDWEMILNGQTSWTRPESLVGVVAAAFVDFVDPSLLDELATEGKQNVVTAYIRRVGRHLNELRSLPQFLQITLERQYSKISGEPSPSVATEASPSGFGFSKFILVATNNGRLAALDSGNQGKVLWNVLAAKLPAGEKWDVLSIELDQDNAVVRGANGEFTRVSVKDGKILAYQPGDLITGLRSTVAVADTNGQITYIPVAEDGSLGSLPSANFPDGTVVVTKADDNTLRGWTLGKKTSATLAWSFLPGSDEEIRSAVPRPAHDPVASIGKALGDRNVLYKYLNPNVMLITTFNARARTATFYMIDSVAGDVLYSVVHSGVDPAIPITSALTENWFAYSLFSETRSMTGESTQTDVKKVKAHQLIVSEMFESPFPNDRGPLGQNANVSARHPNNLESGHTSETPYTISQTYLLSGPISAMSTTSTLQGITPRALICALPRQNSLLSIPRYILDPRRPVGRDPTPAEAEEGMYRYNPILDFEPKWMINHKREILSKVDSILTTPSDLESTSLVFAYGKLDLFGTRVSPIGSFDILGKGFSKLQLVGTVVALAIGTGMLSPYVSSLFSSSSLPLLLLLPSFSCWKSISTERSKNPPGFSFPFPLLTFAIFTCLRARWTFADMNR